MTQPPLTLAILISGRGSNMEALLHACQDPDFPAKAALVIASNRTAAGIEKARAAGIPVKTVDRKDYQNKAGFEAALHDALAESRPDLICLAGFMHLLSADFIDKWPEKIINIHPSLLPAYKGLNTHERVLAAKESKSGCTVHYVTPAMDEGPVIIQKEVPVRDTDSVDDLAQRVLKAEHTAYKEAIMKIWKKRA